MKRFTITETDVNTIKDILDNAKLVLECNPFEDTIPKLLHDIEGRYFKCREDVTEIMMLAQVAPDMYVLLGQDGNRNYDMENREDMRERLVRDWLLLPKNYRWK